MSLSSEEKWQLLGALYNHGTNLEALQAALPSWSSSRLASIIQRYRRRAAKTLATQRAANEGSRVRGKGRTREQDQGRVEQWYDVTQHLHRLQGTSDHWQGRGRRPHSHTLRDHSPLLSKVMASVACLEDHPHPTHAGQPNYTNIYRYLAQTLAGEEPIELDVGSAGKLLDMMARVRQSVDLAEDQITNYHAHLQHLPPETLLPLTREGSASGSDEKRSSSRSSTLEKGSDCPLFQDPEEENGGGDDNEGAGAGVELWPDDPYYEMKQEKLIKKVTEVQREAAVEVSSVPGLNPLHVPPSLLVKPTTFLNPTSL